MNILMLLKRLSPTEDIRVMKEARSLIKAGHNVFILANNNSKKEDVVDFENIKIFRIPQKNEYINRLILVNLFIDYSFLRKTKEIIEEYPIDAIHVHDLPLVKTAIKAAGDLPVVADLHENYPAAVKSYISYFSRRNILRVLSLDTYTTWLKYEKKVLRNVDRIIVVVPEAMERFVKYNLDLEKVYVVSNTEDVKNIPNIKNDAELEKKYEDKFVISYVGGFGPHRGIDTTLKAIPYLKDNIPNIKLLLVGSGKDYNKTLMKIVKRLKLHDYVEFIGWQELKKVYDYMNLSDVCLIPHNWLEHTNTTVPHKLFQSMYLEKPVVVSSCKPLKRIIEETKAGLSFIANDPKNLAEQIQKLYYDEELRKKMGKNGRQAVIDKYNWENDAKELLRLYESLNNNFAKMDN